MNRLLTQEEVDALLATCAEEETGGKDAPILYDLRAPLILAGERLALVLASCERLAGELAEAMTIQLMSDSPVRGTFTGLVQQPASTVLGTLAPAEPLLIVVDEHDEPVGGISLQGELGATIVDRAQGGKGAKLADSRALSGVEKTLLEEALSRLVRHLDRNTPMSPIRGGGLELDLLFGRLASRGGTLATAMFRMSIPEGDAVCRLLLTPVLASRLLTESEAVRVDATPPELEEALSDLQVEIEPAITGASLSVGDLERLTPGQVIQLDARQSEPLSLRCNGEPLAKGRIQRAGGEKLFEIDEFAGVKAGTVAGERQ